MLRLPKPITYLVTSGKTTSATTSSTHDFQKLLELIKSAITAKIDLVQLREKALTTRVLQDLATRAAQLTRGTATKLLINDRPDVAVAAGADGVHLTSHSLPASVVRRDFGQEFVIGVSTHSLAEARAAKADADFAVFGPVFLTPSKADYGSPAGLEQLASVCSDLQPFPVLAIGGVDEDNFAECLSAGAHGVAAIRMFSDPNRIIAIASKVRNA